MVPIKQNTSRKNVDMPLLFIVLALVIAGLAVLYSASTVESFKNHGNTSYYFLRQLRNGGLLGMLGLIIFSRIDYHFWQKCIPWLVGLSLILLVLVKVPGINFSAGGATRWIHVGGFIFQPSELAKFAVVCYMAGWLAKRGGDLKHFGQAVLPALVILGLFAFLILWQPDMGTMLVLVFTAFALMFAGGVTLKHLGQLFFIGVVAVLLMIKLEPYRMNRVLTFLDPNHDPLGVGYQVNQAILAVGAGGLWGYGYGLSRQKYNYLPEALGDSIFAIMAEELGFVRVVCILALFVALSVRGIMVSYKAPDNFGRLLGVGISSWIIIQVFVNIGAMIGIVPLTGITLPLFSYGSSSHIVTLTALGVLLNISRSYHKKKIGAKA